MGNELTPRARFDGLVTKVVEDRCADFLASPDAQRRMTKVALAAAAKNPKLYECAPHTVALSLMHCAELQLEPSSVLGHAYLIPRYSKQIGGQECTFLIGYAGYLELARRSGEVANIHADVVYAGEDFEVWVDDSGQHIRHRKDFGTVQNRRDADIVASYCQIVMKDGAVYSDVCDRADIDARMKAGGSRGFSPWKTHYARMARKSAIRKLLTGGTVPMSAQLRRAHEIETEIEAAQATAQKPTGGVDLGIVDAPAIEQRDDFDNAIDGGELQAVQNQAPAEE